MSWEVAHTSLFEEWFDGLVDVEQQAVIIAIEKLEEFGLGLGRPLVGKITGSKKVKHMKELIPLGGHLRVLFAFDPERCAILLVGGDKKNQWRSWYAEMIPVAEKLYAAHLVAIGKKGRS